MNVENLNKLIAHLEAQPPERINMGWVDVQRRPACGTCGCIAGHMLMLEGRGPTFAPVSELAAYLGISYDDGLELAEPIGFFEERYSVRLYPAPRVIATLKRLRDTYLATGNVVVDWGPEPGEEPKTPWVAPQVAEVIAPALPAEIIGLLRPSLAKTEA